ncbi:MAG: M12 family metallo-peptidase, partial [Pseudomonadota bacterium]
MKTLGLLTACLVFAASASAQTTPMEGLSVQHFEPLRGMQMRADGPLGRNAAVLYEPLRMEFDALGRRFDLELEPNTNLLSPDQRAGLDASIGVYRGRLAGKPDSWVRIVTRDGVPAGLIWDGAELLGIERPGQSAVATNEPVIFRLADMVIEDGTMSCAVGGPDASAADMYKGLVAELQMMRADGAVEEIEIGAVVDALFANGRSNAAQDVLDRLNNVDGIYSSELGIQITVPVVDVFDSQSDPFTATTDGGDLLDEVGAFRVANAPQRQAGLTHMFTGRDLDGSTVGIAYVGALCNNFFGVGLSEGNRGLVTDSLIAAHEIGHNFGASHDGDADGSCPDEPGNLFIMAASVTGSMEFSSCSRDVMTASAAVASCVVPLAAVDVSVTSLGQAEDILLGRAINLTFEVPNDGSENATGVTVDVDLPQNVTFVAAAASQGNFTQGAGTVSFNLGTVAAFSAASVTVTASTDAVGPAAFTATVSATNDGITTNNVDVHTVDIDPAVDLVVTAPNVAATIDSSAVASVTVRNTSILDATALEATVTLDAGIRADSANWT